MKRAFKSTTLSIFLLFVLCHSSGAESWRNVANRGFGDPANDYAWSMTTFQGRLYVGTLNSLTGAQIWCSSSGEQGSWQRVYKSPNPLSWGVRYLYADGDQALYACVFNILGAMILKSYDGQRWTPVARWGLGNVQNYTIRCMVRFGEYLYAGTGSNEAQLFRSKDGTQWELVQTNPGFETTKVKDRLTNNLITNNVMIGELAVFKDKLYAFTWTGDLNIQSLHRVQNIRDYITNFQAGGFDPLAFLAPKPGAFEVWRSSDGTNWEKVVGLDDAYGNGLGFSLHDPENLDNDVVTSTTVFRSYLYLGTESASSNSTIWRTNEGTRWEKVLDFFELGERYNHYVWRMISFNDRLFIGTFNVGPKFLPGVTGAQIWASRSGEPGTFYNLVRNGFDGSTIPVTYIEMPKNYGIRTFGILRGKLFAGTATMLSIMSLDQELQPSIIGKDVGCEIWKFNP